MTMRVWVRVRVRMWVPVCMRGARGGHGARLLRERGRAPSGGVDFDAHAHDLLARLREELALLVLEVAAGGAGAHGRGRGREERHELVPGGGRGELATGGEGALGVEGRIDIWRSASIRVSGTRT